MPRRVDTIADFSVGELDPKLNARIGTDLHNKSVYRLENFIPDTKGPLRYKPGNTNLGYGSGVLHEFIYGSSRYCIMNFGSIMHVARNGALIMETTVRNITGATKANPCVITSVAHGLSNGNYVYISGIGGMTELLGGPYIVAGVTANTFQLKNRRGQNINSTAYTTYTSGGTILTPYQINTAWTGDVIKEQCVRQIDDRLYFCHRSHKTRYLTNGGSDTSWTLSSYAPTADPFTSANNYPGAVCGHERRAIFASTNNDPMKFWATVAEDVDDLTLGTGATDAFTNTLAGGPDEEIYNLHSREKSLFILGSQNVHRVRPVDDAVFASGNVESRLLSPVGSAKRMSVDTDNMIIFLQSGRKKVRAIDIQAAMETQSVIRLPYLNFSFSNLARASSIDLLSAAEGEPNMLFCVHDDGSAAMMAFNEDEGVFGWSRLRLARYGRYKHLIRVQTESGFDQIYAVIEYRNNLEDNTGDQFLVYWDTQIEAPNREEYDDLHGSEATETESYTTEMWEAQKKLNMFDSAIVYDGRTAGSVAGAGLTLSATSGASVTVTASASVFASSDVGREIWTQKGDGRGIITAYSSGTSITISTAASGGNAFHSTSLVAGEWYLTTAEVTGLRALEGFSVGVLEDGDYKTATVTNGKVTLTEQTSYAIIGINSPGKVILHRLNQEDGNSIAEMDSVNRIGIVFEDSADVKYGFNNYDLELENKERQFGDLNSRVPPLFSGSKALKHLDAASRDKRIIIKQDQGKPTTIKAVKLEYRTSGGS